jgi:hypothetical protein
MPQSTSVIRDFVIRSLLAFAGCLLVGIFFFQADIFDPIAVPFRFISNGILGSVVFAALRSVPIRTSFIIFLLTAVVLIAVFTWPLELPFILTDGVLFIGIGLALYVVNRTTFVQMQPIRWARPLVFSSLLALINIAASILMMFYHRDFVLFSQPPFETISMGFLIGLGLGIGCEVGEMVTGRSSTARS